MKKRYMVILSFILVILSISYVSAVDNDTNILTEENQDVISINKEKNDMISISENENEIINAIDGNNSQRVNESNFNELLGISVNTSVLTATSTENVLTVSSSDTILSASSYKTPTKKQRTFYIGGFKAVLSQSQYKKLFKATTVEDIFFDDGYSDYYYIGEKFRGYGISSTGLHYTITVKTNKFIKVKVKIGKKYKYKKTRAYMQFTYGAGQAGIAYRYMITLTHKYDNPGYDYCKELGSNAKYFTKCKHSLTLNKLNKCKLYNTNSVYRVYSI